MLPGDSTLPPDCSIRQINDDPPQCERCGEYAEDGELCQACMREEE